MIFQCLLASNEVLFLLLLFKYYIKMILIAEPYVSAKLVLAKRSSHIKVYFFFFYIGQTFINFVMGFAYSILYWLHLCIIWSYFSNLFGIPFTGCYCTFCAGG